MKTLIRHVRRLHETRSSTSLEERQFKLDLEKYARERLWREEERAGQALTWLFTSQVLLGGSYAYLKQQLISAMERNWIGRWKDLKCLVEYFPYIAVVLGFVFLFTVLSSSKVQNELRSDYPDVFGGESWLAQTKPAAHAVIGGLFTFGWFVVLIVLP